MLPAHRDETARAYYFGASTQTEDRQKQRSFELDYTPFPAKNLENSI
jgi:hypothetical protein